MYEAAASCKDIVWTPVTNCEPHGVSLTGYCYAVRHRIKVQLVTPYHVSHLQRYSVTVRGNITGVHPPLQLASAVHGKFPILYHLTHISRVQWYYR